MKFSCGVTWEHEQTLFREYAERVKHWHRVFAWLPVQVGEEAGFKKCVWLGWVERRIVYSPRDYGLLYKHSAYQATEYREIQA